MKDIHICLANIYKARPKGTSGVRLWQNSKSKIAFSYIVILVLSSSNPQNLLQSSVKFQRTCSLTSKLSKLNLKSEIFNICTYMYLFINY